MNNSLQNVLDHYKNAECPSLTGGHLFSRFATDMAFSGILSKNKIRVSQLWTDGMGDLQQDGLCILIDGKAVTDEEEARSAIARCGGISKVEKVRLFFLQSKSKNSFDLTEFNTFTSGIENFLLNDKVPAGSNCKIQAWWHVWRLIYKEIFKAVGPNKPEVVITAVIAFSGSDLNNEYIEDQKKVVNKKVSLSLRFPVKVVFKTLGEKELLELYAKRKQAAAKKASQPAKAPDAPAQRQAPAAKKQPAPVQSAPAQAAGIVSPWKVKEILRQCRQDPDGYVFLAELGGKVRVLGPLKEYIAKFPGHFQFDCSGEKVRAVRSATRQPCQRQDAAPEARDELRSFINGRIATVDTYDRSGSVLTKNYGEIAFNFSDLMYPLQERELDSGKFARFEVDLWRGSYKVKGGTLQVI